MRISIKAAALFGVMFVALLGVGFVWMKAQQPVEAVAFVESEFTPPDPIEISLQGARSTVVTFRMHVVVGEAQTAEWLEANWAMVQADIQSKAMFWEPTVEEGAIEQPPPRRGPPLPPRVTPQLFQAQLKSWLTQALEDHGVPAVQVREVLVIDFLRMNN